MLYVEYWVVHYITVFHHLANDCLRGRYNCIYIVIADEMLDEVRGRLIASIVLHCY